MPGDQEPQIKKESKPILSLEAFSNRGSHGDKPPEYNKFFLFFADSFSGEAYRAKNSLIIDRFEREQPEMAKALRAKIRVLVKDKLKLEDLRIFDAKLYEAYKIMRGYGASDRELFA